MTTLYLDHNATTEMRPEAVEAVVLASSAGNPSSVHRLGRRAEAELEQAREAVRDLVGAPGSARVLLTSGGTEADNLAIWGLAQHRRAKGGANVLILSDLEHPAVRESVDRLAGDGFRPRRARVDAEGQLDLDVFPSADELRGTALIALMLANNETGVIQPVAEIAAAAAAAGVPVHVDAVQAAGKIPIDFNELGATSLAISAHKFGGPRGTGALVLREDAELLPLWGGGLQQEGLRPGTEALALARGMAAAAESARAELVASHLRPLRDRLESQLRQRFGSDPADGCEIIGANRPRLPNTCSIRFAGVQGQALVRRLDAAGILIGAGAACHGDEVRVSAVLTAMGIPAQRAVEVVRISLGWTTDAAAIDRAIDAIRAAVEELRQR